MATNPSKTPSPALPVSPLMAVDSWLTPGRFAAVLGALIFVAYPEVILGWQTFFIRDFGYFAYPMAHHFRESFWRGEIPLWNPLNNCGLPFLAQWNSMVLYPGSLFYLLFPLSWSLGVFCLGHQFLAGFGMYILARRWTRSNLAAAVAGVAFAFNGLTLNSLMWPNNIAALGWMPWVVYLVERAWREGGRRLVGAVLVGALQMLTGAPEVIILTWLFVVALAVAVWWNGRIQRRSLAWRSVLVPLGVAGVAAAQLLPFLDFLPHSQRNSGFGGSEWSLPLWGWANFLVPLFHCRPGFQGVFIQYGQYWTSSYYPGIGVLALALLAVWRAREFRIWLLALLTTFSLAMGLGADGQLYSWLQAAFPVFGFMRYPVKFTILILFCLPLLAAFGVRWLQHSTALLPEAKSGASEDVEERPGNFRCANPAAPQKPWTCIAILAAALLVVILLVLGWSQHAPGPGEDWRLTRQNGLGRGVFLLLVPGLLYAITRLRSRTSQGLLGVGLLVLLALDAQLHMPRQNPTLPRHFVDGRYASLWSPRPVPGAGRIMVSLAAERALSRRGLANPVQDYLCNRQALFVNCNLLEGVPIVDGTFSLYLLRHEVIRQALLYASTNTTPQLAALGDFLAITHTTAASEIFEWELRPSARPWITAGQTPRFADNDTILLQLAQTNLDLRHRVYLRAADASLVNATNQAKTTVWNRRFSAHRIEVEVETDQPTVLVVAQAFYHPWRAYVDGQRTPILHANYAFQAVPISSAGRHEVRLVYEDRMFQAGVGLSAMSLVACLIGWMAAGRGRRRAL